MRTLLWIALGLAILLGLLWQFYPLADAKSRAQELPLFGPGFSGENVPISDFEKDFFGDAVVVKRLYKVGKDDYFVTVVDGTHNRHVVHDPYYCLTGSGWQIDEEKQLPIAGGTVVQLKLSKGNERNQVLFWFSDASVPFQSAWKYWWEATLRRLTLGRSGEEPVLTFVMLLNNKEPNWNEFAHLFPQIFHL